MGNTCINGNGNGKNKYLGTKTSDSIECIKLNINQIPPELSSSIIEFGNFFLWNDSQNSVNRYSREYISNYLLLEESNETLINRINQSDFIYSTIQEILSKNNSKLKSSFFDEPKLSSQNYK